MKYSQTFKSTMVRKLADPCGPSANQLAAEVGVHQSTLSRWLRAAGKVNDLVVVPITPHARSSMSAKRPQDWTAEEKLAVVLEAEGLCDEDLGAFLRRKGLHESHLQQWRELMLSGLSGLSAPVARRAAKNSPEAKKVRALEKELARKEKALAEAAALLVLKKKAQAIWGDEDDATAKKRGR